MIKTEEQLAVVRMQLGRVERALESLRQDVKNPRNFALYSESYVEQMNILKAEIDAYVNRASDKTLSMPVTAAEPHPTNVS
jgi:hypothetical protein